MPNVEAPNVTGHDQLLDIEKMLNDINENRIKLESFRGDPNFPDEEIDRDIESCKRKEQAILEDRKNWPAPVVENYQRSQAAEYSFRHALMDYGWLGKNAALMVTSQYDDYYRGIDTVAAVKSEGRNGEETRHVGFAIDFSIAADKVGEKIRRTFDDLDNGYCPRIKYFDSESTGKCKNFRVPRIVIGASGDSLKRLISFSEEIIDGSGVADRSDTELAKDPFQYIFFGELLSQLGTYCGRLEKVIEEALSKNRPDIERRARETLDIHKKAFDSMMKIMFERHISMQDIQKHMRGDQFASSMGPALSILSRLPVAFQENKLDKNNSEASI